MTRPAPDHARSPREGADAAATRMAGEYREFAPPARLAGHVACLWTRSTAANAPAAARVVPDGCVDIVWFRDGALLVAGPDTGPVLNALPPRASIVGARFLPGAAPVVLGVPADELRDARVPLDAIWGDAARRLTDELATTGAAGRALALLGGAVAARLATAPPRDELAQAALAAIARQPEAGLPALGARLGVGERQLRRRFVAAVGYGPKTYQRVARFQRLLALARRRPAARLDLAALAAEAGYADQAHMTPEVARLGGTTPGTLLTAP